MENKIKIGIIGLGTVGSGVYKTLQDFKNSHNYIKKPWYNQGMYLAVDIGGTKTLIALFSRRGRVIRRLKFKTAQGSKTFIDELTRNLAKFRRRKIKSVVVAIPGVVQKNY